MLGFVSLTPTLYALYTGGDLGNEQSRIKLETELLNQLK
jgi:hypothetical protein